MMWGVTLKPSRCHLVTYNGQRTQPQGEATIKVNGNNMKFQVTTQGSAILGKDACVKPGARVDKINTQAQAQPSQEMVNKYSHVFNRLGLIKSNGKIHINEEITPVIDPSRRIPIVIADDVQKELQRMIDLGVIIKQEPHGLIL